ncbi:6444_t:CDS:2, partial [Acaulospora colombiana]
MADEVLVQQLEKLQLRENYAESLENYEVNPIEGMQGCHKILVTRELLLRIFCALPVRVVLKMRLVCRLWETILRDDYTWQQVFESKFGKVPNSLFLDNQTYRSICIFKEYHETRLWSKVASLFNEPASTTLNRFKLFGEFASLNSYMYDIIATGVIENGVAIALVGQRRLVLDEPTGMRVINERPTLSNMDFNLVPNVEIRVYVRLMPFKGQDRFEIICCDKQLLTISRDDLSRDGGWIKNVVRIQLGRKYFMYSSDISMGTCKIFSYYQAQSLGNFNVHNPPLTELAISRNFFVTCTEPGNFQLTTHASSCKHMIRSTDLEERYKFGINIDDVQIKNISRQSLKGKMSAFYMDHNDLMIAGYYNNEGESVFRVWDLRGVREHESFETREYKNMISQYEGKLESKAQSFLVRWKDDLDEYRTPLDNELEYQLKASPEIIVTCSGGNIAIFRLLDTIGGKLKCSWRISTGLTFLKVVDTQFWSPGNLPSNGNWLFLSAKKTIGDMKVPVVVQLLLLPSTMSTENSNDTNFGYLDIDNHNPNNNEDNVMPHLPHALVVLCLRKEPDFCRPRPRYSLMIYDYHTSNMINNLHSSSPFMFVVPTGYFVMAPKHSFKDDIIYMPLPRLKSRDRQVVGAMLKPSRPRLQPDGMNRLRVNRGVGKRMKQPKATKIDKRKHRSSKIQFSVRDYNIDYDEHDI